MKIYTRKHKAAKWILSLSLIISLASAPLTVQAVTIPITTTKKSEDVASKQMNEVYSLIEKSHVSGISKDKLSQAAIQAMVKELDDPYTQYFSKEEWDKYNSSLEQSYVGIGVRIMKDDIGIYIAEVFANSPAQGADIRKGDYIVAVEGNPVKDKSTDEIVNSIMGPEGTQVNVTVQRQDSNLDKSMNRQTISIPAVTSHMFQDGVGYIGLSSFTSDADEKFAAMLAEMKSQGIKSLVIDLRGNPGGLLTTAANIAKQFMTEGVLINTKEKGNVNGNVTIKDGSTVSFPVYVLVDEHSASASEVLTGALQDYKLATVMGTKTYGKGSVQQIVSLSGGAALKLTIEEYLTPNMREVNKKGLEPEKQVEGEIPQLIAALRQAGISDFDVTMDKHAYHVNGYEVIDVVKWIQKDTQIYVPSRLLAALVDSQITWNESLKTVAIQSGAANATFAVPSDDMIFENGTTYVRLEAFQQQFPQLQWNATGDQISFHVKKGN